MLTSEALHQNDTGNDEMEGPPFMRPNTFTNLGIFTAINLFFGHDDEAEADTRLGAGLGVGPWGRGGGLPRISSDQFFKTKLPRAIPLPPYVSTKRLRFWAQSRYKGRI